jgi:hypothetical protein
MKIKNSFSLLKKKMEEEKKIEWPKIFDAEKDLDVAKLYIKYEKMVNRTMVQLIAIGKVSHIDHFGLSFSIFYKPNTRREIILRRQGELITYIEYVSTGQLRKTGVKFWLGDAKRPLDFKAEGFELTFLSQDVYKITNIFQEIKVTYVKFSDEFQKVMEKKLGEKTDPQKNGFH